MQNGIMLPSVADKKKYREQRAMAHISSAKQWSHFVWFCANGFHKNAQKELQLLCHK